MGTAGDHRDSAIQRGKRGILHDPISSVMVRILSPAMPSHSPSMDRLKAIQTKTHRFIDP
jgi:hypothetical protein